MEVPEDSNLWEWEIGRLEFFIKLSNQLIKWLNSNDPMFQQDEYRPLVGPTKERLTNEVRQMIIVCRAKKVEHQKLEDEFVEHVRIGLKPGRLTASKL